METYAWEPMLDYGWGKNKNNRRFLTFDFAHKTVVQAAKTSALKSRQQPIPLKRLFWKITSTAWMDGMGCLSGGERSVRRRPEFGSVAPNATIIWFQEEHFFLVS